MSSKQILRSQEKGKCKADQLTSEKKPRQRIDGATQLKEEATYGHLFIATFSILKGDKAWIEPCSAHMIDWQYLSLGHLEQKEFFSKMKS